MSVAALAAGFAAAPLPAQTNVTTGGVEVRAFLARSTTDVYAAAYGAGLHRSSDAGATWSRIELPSNERYLTAVDGNSSLVIVGGDEGLLRSTNGTTFTRVLHEPVAAVAVAPSGTTVLATVKGVGIVRSTDSGATFTVANNSTLTSTDMTAVVFHPSSSTTAYAASKPNGAGSGGGVYRSTDGGQTWTALAAIPTVNGANHVTSLVVDSAGTPLAGVLRPLDGGGDVYRLSGSSWLGTNDPFGVVSLHRDAAAGTTIWAGSRYLGIRSGTSSSATGYSYPFANNGGSPSFFYTSVNAAVSTTSGVVLKALRGAGVWRSASSGSPRSWTRVSFPGADRVLSAASVASSSSTFVAGLHAGGVWRTSNTGSSWTAPTVSASQADFTFSPSAFGVNAFASIWELSASPSNANLIYAAAGGVGMFYSNDNPGLFRWDGTAWRGIGSNATASAPWNGAVEGGVLTLPSPQIYGVTLGADDSTTHASFLGPAYGVFRRSGGTWTSIAIPGVTPQVRGVVRSADPNKLLALPFDDKPVISTNAGASYTQVSVSQAGFERLRFFGAAEDPANTSVWLGATNKGIYRSTDGGSSWTRVALGATFQQQAISAIGFKSNGVAFAADFDGNRYCSSAASAGATWVSAGTKLRAGVNAIRTIGTSLYYLTDGAGMFREDGTC